MAAVGNGDFEATLPHTAVQFVLNNGGDDWDTPALQGDKNYHIRSAGVYKLRRGSIEKEV